MMDLNPDHRFLNLIFLLCQPPCEILYLFLQEVKQLVRSLIRFHNAESHTIPIKLWSHMKQNRK